MFLSALFISISSDLFKCDHATVVPAKNLRIFTHNMMQTPFIIILLEGKKQCGETGLGSGVGKED